jgi:aspartate aminotransferase
MSSLFAHMVEAPPDPILNTTKAFNDDKDPRKINLGVGAYRNEAGKPYVLDVVREAEEEILKELGTGNNKEYSTIDGPEDLQQMCRSLLFGDCAAVQENRVSSFQALSGTGALRIVAEFIKTHLPPAAHEIWVSDPTWGNHTAIFQNAGLTPKVYPYWNAKTKGIDFDGMIDALRSQAAEGSVVLLHACAHNPTGVDPTQEQWVEIARVMKEKKLIPLMDSAYQGYASGDLDYDSWAVRYFEQEGFEFFMCQSFAKNLGLYGERIGCVHIVCNSAERASIVSSQMKLVIRPMYSNPPKHGALIVAKVLGNPERFARWRAELKAMADRILEVRAMLRKGLEDKGTAGPWNHITDQIGMFSFTGLSQAECERLISKHHIYLLKSGRISLAGLNKSNVQYMVDSVDEVRRFCSQSKL